MDFLGHTHFGGILPMIRPDAVESRLAQVEAVVEKHFGHDILVQ